MRYGGAYVGTCALRIRDLWRGQVFPSEDSDLPCLASSQVELAIVRQRCAKVGKSQGSQPKVSPSGSHMRAGQTFPP